MSKIIENLKMDEQRILDLALDYGFSSHANFSRAFKEIYGITLTEYKNTIPLLNTFDKPDISMKYIIVDEEVPLIIDDIVLEVKRRKITKSEKYIGFVTDVNINEQIPIGENTGVDAPGQLWNKFHKEKNALLEFVNLNMKVGISYMSESESFEKLVSEALIKANKYLFETWIPNHQLMVEPFSAEKYYLNCDDRYRMEIWLKLMSE